MQDLPHLVMLLEIRVEQLQLHLRSVRVGCVEERKTRALIATMRMRKRLLQQFALYDGRTTNGMTVH